MTVQDAYPSDRTRTIEVEGERLTITFEHDPFDTISRVLNAVGAYGIRGTYESLAEAVEALGRRAEAAEAQGEEADEDEILTHLVEALNEGMAGDPVTIVRLALDVRRDLCRRYRLVPIGE